MSIDYMAMIEQLERHRDMIDEAIDSLQKLADIDLPSAGTSRGYQMELPIAVPKRPGPNTKTGRIWEICDQFYLGTGDVPTLDEVVHLGIAEDLNVGTINSQYRRWRKFLKLTTDIDDKDE